MARNIRSSNKLLFQQRELLAVEDNIGKDVITAGLYNANKLDASGYSDNGSRNDSNSDDSNDGNSLDKYNNDRSDDNKDCEKWYQ